MTSRIPRNPSSAYGLGEFINLHGATEREELLTRFKNNNTRVAKQAALRVSIDCGWLHMNDDSIVSLTGLAKRHFAVKAAQLADVVPRRIVNVYASGPLQSKYIPKHPDLRDDFFLMAASV